MTTPTIIPIIIFVLQMLLLFVVAGLAGDWYVKFEFINILPNFANVMLPKPVAGSHPVDARKPDVPHGTLPVDGSLQHLLSPDVTSVKLPILAYNVGFMNPTVPW